MPPVPQGPPRYDASLIRPVRPPEVEGRTGQWDAAWQLTAARPRTDADLRRAGAAICAATGIAARLTLLPGSRVRLETTTQVHPLDAEAWPVMDAMLVALDDQLGLATINDCPRAWWRPFRPRGSRRPS